MLCPNCGTKTTTEHKFCRNCGMNLEPVARALAAHLSVGGAAAARAARAADRRTVRRMTSGLLAGVFVVLFGLLLIAFLPGKGFKFLGVAAALIGIVAALVSVLSPLRSMGGAEAEAPPPALDASAPNTGRLLHEQTFDRVPASVTDRTTELLNVEVKDRKPRD
ncbi:MAG TPA: zinc-ribbon domain-containing protein [Pyrinomonadaceae bacterium]|nr:zinc-ribbon domain-containing protein [Pyrinomonadaceae bacterium]